MTSPALADAAFAAFAREAAPRLLRLGHSLTGSAADAEDLVQECLVRVGLAWPRLRDRAEAGPYARKTLMNLFLNERRHRGREATAVARLGSDQGVDDVHEQLALREAKALLAALPPKQRAAVALRYVLDLDDDAIAAALGCSTSTVRSQIARGLEHLRSVTLREGDLR